MLASSIHQWPQSQPGLWRGGHSALKYQLWGTQGLGGGKVRAWLKASPLLGPYFLLSLYVPQATALNLAFLPGLPGFLAHTNHP